MPPRRSFEIRRHSRGGGAALALEELHGSRPPPRFGREEIREDAPAPADGFVRVPTSEARAPRRGNERRVLDRVLHGFLEMASGAKRARPGELHERCAAGERAQLDEQHARRSVACHGARVIDGQQPQSTVERFSVYLLALQACCGSRLHPSAAPRALPGALSGSRGVARECRTLAPRRYRTRTGLLPDDRTSAAAPEPAP